MIPEIKRILYATDLSINSAHAFRYAVYFSNKFEADIIILHVIEEVSPDAKLTLYAYLDKKALREILEGKVSHAIERIENRLKVFCAKELEKYPECAEKIVSIEVSRGYPEEEILKKADDLKCDAILMGTHKRGSTHSFIGSVAKRVMRRTGMPVFLIPLPKGEIDISFHDL